MIRFDMYCMLLIAMHIGLTLADSGYANSELLRRRRAVSDLSERLGDLEKKMKSQVKEKQTDTKYQALLETVSKLKTDVDSDKSTTENIEKAGKVVDKITANLETFRKGDASQITRAVLDITSSVAGFLPPPAGTIVSTVLSLVSGIVSMFGEKERTLADVLKEVIDERLKAFKSDEIKAKIEGGIRDLEFASDIIATHLNKELSEGKLTLFGTQVHALSKLDLIGEVQKYIRDRSTQKDDEAYKNTLEAINLYLEITAAREVLTQGMYSIMLMQGNRSNEMADALARIIIREKNDARKVLSFIRQPTVPTILFFTQYDVKNDSSIEARLDSFEAPPRNKTDLYPSFGDCWMRIQSRSLNKAMYQGDLNYFYEVLGWNDKPENIDSTGNFKFEKNDNNTWSIINHESKYLMYKNYGIRHNLLSKKLSDVSDKDMVKFNIYRIGGGFVIVPKSSPSTPLVMGVRTIQGYIDRYPVITNAKDYSDTWKKIESDTGYNSPYLWDFVGQEPSCKVQ